MFDTSRSKALFQRAQQSIPGGVNSPVRAFKSVGGEPLFFAKGQGSHLFDVDGNRYIDYVGSWGPLILGHADPVVLEAVSQAMAQGTSFGAPTEREVELAVLVQKAMPSLELVRFVNSGTEATLGALRVARGYTKRDKVVKFAGCYHGAVDALLVKAGSGATTLGVPDSAGVPAGVAADTLLAEFNDLEQVEALAKAHAGKIAAVILEAIPGNMGMIEPDPAFLQGLRALCDREGIVLIVDEVMTGFRVAYGGAQALLQLRPDLSVFGKVIGGGLPVGAYGGRKEIMSQVAPLGPVYQAGTLSGNPLAMAAGIATLSALQKPGLYQELERKGRLLLEGLTEAAKAAGIATQAICHGGMMGFFFSPTPIRNYTQVGAMDAAPYRKFFHGMLNEGVYLAPSAYEALFVSTAHTDQDINNTVAAAQKVMRTL